MDERTGGRREGKGKRLSWDWDFLLPLLKTVLCAFVQCERSLESLIRFASLTYFSALPFGACNGTTLSYLTHPLQSIKAFRPSIKKRGATSHHITYSDRTCLFALFEKETDIPNRCCPTNGPQRAIRITPKSPGFLGIWRSACLLSNRVNRCDVSCHCTYPPLKARPAA
jgi:hypothetical protein